VGELLDLDGSDEALGGIPSSHGPGPRGNILDERLPNGDATAALQEQKVVPLRKPPKFLFAPGFPALLPKRDSRKWALW
jgi:hypothetical protein